MSTNPPKDVVEVASHDLFGIGGSPHRCSTLLCGAPATMRRPRRGGYGDFLGWYNNCPICYSRNKPWIGDPTWEEIILPNVQVEGPAA